MMSDTALDVLNMQITEYQVDIENLKIKVADCAIKAHSTEPTEVSLIFDNLHKMAKLISQVKSKEVLLDELLKTKTKIEDELEKRVAND
ncbi:MAG: hypothetical protein IJ681_06140 [Bacteroidales bacterium]|nr:hypothetical protein [Bacteroidales bacterium]